MFINYIVVVKALNFITVEIQFWISVLVYITWPIDDILNSIPNESPMNFVSIIHPDDFLRPLNSNKQSCVSLNVVIVTQAKPVNDLDFVGNLKSPTLLGILWLGANRNSLIRSY